MPLDGVAVLVTNNCGETIWPGIGTQHGIGPGTGGFELKAGKTTELRVSHDWQGRFWGRTNCTFNAEGGPAPASHGNSACTTGDCAGQLNCAVSGAPPSTLAEFNLRGGDSGSQTFYDISLVDGYNLPVAIVHRPGPATEHVPPSLTNLACIATAGWLAEPARSGLAYTNISYPIPYEASQTNDRLGRWCPWDLQLAPPYKPGDGVYPYPDDDIVRPGFDPCRSTCAAYGRPSDCCTEEYKNPDVCKPSLYSRNAKVVCPDAYSYAFDDRTSTFTVPAGGGWEVIFCPAGRSTDILRTFGNELMAVASGNTGVDISRQTLARKLAESKGLHEPFPPDSDFVVPAAAEDDDHQATLSRRSAGTRAVSCKQALGLGLLLAALGAAWF